MIYKKHLNKHERQFFVIVIMILTYLGLNIVYALFVLPIIHTLFAPTIGDTWGEKIDLSQALTPSITTEELLTRKQRESNIITKPTGRIEIANTIACGVWSLQTREEISGQLICLSSPIIQKTIDCIAPNGQTIKQGEIYIGYKPLLSECESQERKCIDGKLDGESQFILDQCVTIQQQNSNTIPCKGQNDELIPHGSYIALFKDKIAHKDQNCEFIETQCNNGKLTNKYDFTHYSCSFTESLSNEYITTHPEIIDERGQIISTKLTTSKEESDAIKTCKLPRWQEITHSQQIFTFEKPSVPFDEYCTFSVVECDNGAFIGWKIFQYPSCRMQWRNNNTCLVQWQEIADGQSITTYKSSDCSSTVRKCDKWTLQGDQNYSLLSCKIWIKGQARCPSPRWGPPIEHGKKITAYNTTQVPYGQSCDPHAQRRTCDNGTLDGSYKFKSCKPLWGESCTTPRWSSIKHGEKIKAYTKNIYTFGEKCEAENNMQLRECDNGTLKWSFGHQSCQKNEPRNCTLPDQSVIKHDATITLYQFNQVQGVPEDGIDQCPRQVRKCFDGTRIDFSGQPNPYTFKYRECNVLPPSFDY